MKKTFIKETMITLKILTLFLFYLHNSYAAKIPDCWLKSSECSQHNFTNNQIKELDESMDQIFEMKSDLVETIGEKSDHRKKYHLASMKTGLGLEVSGEIGIIESGGEAVLELIWSRKKPKKNFLNNNLNFQDEYFGNENSLDNPLDLSNANGVEDVRATVENLGLKLSKNGKIKNKNLFVKTALAEINKIMSLKKIMNQNPNRPWWPYKIQLELCFQADGRLLNGANVGGGFILKLSWNRLEKINQFLPTTKLPIQEQLNADVIDVLGLEFEKAYLKYQQNATNDKIIYDLSNIKIGVGIGTDGNIFVAKTKGSVVASIFYKRKDVPHLSVENKMDDSINSNILFKEDQQSFMAPDLKSFNVGADKIAYGLNKMMNAAHYFSKKAQQREEKFTKRGKVPKFNLNFIEIELEVFSSGDIGLTTLKGITVMELFLTRIN